MRFEKTQIMQFFANANHTFNTLVKLMHTIKLIAPRKVRVIVFML